MPSRHSARVTLSLPGEEMGRRSFLKKGILGTLLLAGAGGAWLGTRKTRPIVRSGEALRVFSPAEAAVLLAVANRLVPDRPGFPRPADLDLVKKVDAIAAMADAPTQSELRQLVRLFESPIAGLLLDGQPRLFTAQSPGAQDRRLAAWARSRVALRRTGYRALKRLVYAAYYSSPEAWPAIGYPGPPLNLAPARGAARPERVEGAESKGQPDGGAAHDHAP